MGTIIKNGTVITASDTVLADLLIEGEQVALIGQQLPPQGHQVIDATGKLLLPGGIDVHTHLELPFGGTLSSDDYFTGQRAAAFGATTTHIDFVIQQKGGSLKQAVEMWHQKAAGKTVIDYGFHIAITDLRDEVMAEIPSLVDEGISSIKLFLAYKGALQVDDTTLFRSMVKAAEAGILSMVHAENGDVIAELVASALAKGNTAPIYHAKTRPAIVEGEATNRAVALAGVAGAPLYVVHMTCRQALAALAQGRQQGFPVMGETCTQYLFIFEEELGKPGFEGAKFVCSPPMRTPADAAAIWQALANHTLQVVSTDHCPFWYEGGVNGRLPGKEMGRNSFAAIPNGVPGIENRMGVMWQHGVNGGRISANRFVELMSTNPAKIFGLYPRKGTIAVGADADVVIWDPQKQYTIRAATQQMNTDYSLYEGMQLTGYPDKVLLRGKVIVDGNEWKGQRGAGQYLPRQAHAPLL
jgi:dihydropyrimidinase